MATSPAQLSGETLIRQQISALKLPKGVRFLHVQEVEDSTDESAWRITFSVSKSLPLTKHTLSQLQTVRKAVRSVILPMSLGKWSFVRFTQGK